MKLLIVESPSKSKTIEHYLGPDFKVVASLGHIRDLKIKGKGGFGVDVENNFQPEYEILKDKVEVVEELKKLAKKAECVYLATDLDREGEAISWHLQEVLKDDNQNFYRIVFNEITKGTVLKSIENPRDVDMNLVHSQESRRIIDRIIGFRLSSLLQQKIGSKSAGRVQSVALKLLVDREKEIDAFNKSEYWDLFLIFNKSGKTLKAKLSFINEEKANVPNEEKAKEIINELQKGRFIVSNVTEKERKKAPKAPFITSSLEQDAGTRFHYNAKRTMLIAQKLYEGIDIAKGERVGLITYMRTDSVRLSDEFIKDAKNYIVKNFGANYYKGYTVKTKKDQKIQDAHEAIRPTSLERTPEAMKKYLSNDEYKIYSLIYNRALAAIMKDSLVLDTTVSIKNGKYIFQISGEEILFDGFQKLYIEQTEDETSDELVIMPKFEVGEEVNKEQVYSEQKFTLPPSRYSEVRLIKKMDELGIGRPSTYAITMETLRIRSYVTMDKRSFVPTEQGKLTSEQLDLFFSSIINVKYTAQMETILDEISEGKLVWYEEIAKFYDKFAPLIEKARDEMVKIYPKPTDEFCPVCGMPLLIRRGPFGEFTACSGYPYCKYIKKTPKPEPVHTGVTCPVCGEGDLVERINVRGRTKGAKFYACSKFPKCRATFSGLPTGEKCPVCGGILVNVDGEILCSNERCQTNKERRKKEKEEQKNIIS